METVREGTRELVSSPQLVKIPFCKSEDNHRFDLVRHLRSHWKELGSACVCGIGFGLVVAAVAAPRADDTALNSQTRITAAPLTSARKSVPARANMEELSRLKARNRRLEALVEVLRERARHDDVLGDHPRNRDANAEIGQ